MPESPRFACRLSPHPSISGGTGKVKRTLDVVLSIIGLVIFALPLTILVWLIRRKSPGPGFYSQVRVGLGGREFVLVKLRTMHDYAERGCGPAWAVEHDPRCTRLGGMLRRWGIDELPQLWNVLKGDMSLVGPRPERPEFQAVFEKKFAGFERRLAVRGGITGLAQIRGWRGDTPIDRRLHSDLEYIKTWSLANDVAILLKTPLSLLRLFRSAGGTLGLATPSRDAAESLPAGKQALDAAPFSSRIDF
jgi:lipopolysaccharide/colanic/teichoic acid biosynthesis glycosyltransferase